MSASSIGSRGVVNPMRPAVRPESPKGIDAGSSVSPSMPGSAVSGTPPHSPIIDELLRQRVTEVFSAVPLIASEADSGAAGSVDISPFQYAARSPIVRADPSRTETAATQLLSFIKRYGAPVQHMMLPDRSVVTLGMALGQGAFGTVRHGFISNASYSSIEHAAVKFVALRSHSRTGAESDATYQANAEIEYQNYRTFDGHPNFVQCLGAYRVTDDLSKRPSSEVDQDIYPVAMVLELAGPSLASELGRMPRLPMPHVSSEAGPVPVLVGNDTVALARFDGQMIAKFQSLLTAGCAMVEAGKVHQDIKPGNILVGNDGCLKVADFGGMRDIDSDTGMAPNSSQTSPLYASYEQLSYKPLTSKSDVFSMGRVFYEMLTGVRWVKEMPSPDHFDLSKCSGHLALLDHVPGITTGMKDLLVRMMAKDPADRPTFEEASLALTALTQPERLAAEVIPTPETVAPPPPRPQEPPPKAVGARFTSGLGGRPVKPRYEKSPTVPFAGKGAEGTKVPKGGAGGATVVRFDAASGEIVPTELVVNEKLGAGHFSTVKRGTWIDELGSADVAIKRAKGASDVWAANRTMAEMAAEFEIIQLFDDDPRCVQVFMLGHYEGEKGTPHPILVMERGIGTLKIADGGLNPEKALPIIRQLIDIGCMLEEKGVCHRDLKPDNLLVGRDGRLKVTDFGLAVVPEGGWGDPGASFDIASAGTPRYMPPEGMGVFGPSFYTKTSDVFSMGCTIYRIITGHHYLEDVDKRTKSGEPLTLRRIVRIHAKRHGKEKPVSALLKAPNESGKRIIQLLDQMLQSDPGRRPTFSEIRDWMSGVFPEPVVKVVPETPESSSTS